MPVYIRKNISYTPPSLRNFEGEDDEDDYLMDPEQIRDLLPQPYRMVDKLLTGIVDDVWEIIASREHDRISDSNRIRPPRYECSIQMQHHASATCLCDSVDGEYIFVGLPNGLAAIESITQTTTAVWTDDNVEIAQIKCHLLTPQIYLISTIDDMGLARLFAYSSEKLYLLKVLNETEGSAAKLNASQCEASRDGDYVGVVLENPSNPNIWLEMHRLPKDSWVKELESLSPKKESTPPVQIGTDPSTQGEATENTEDSSKLEPDQNLLKPQQPLGRQPCSTVGKPPVSSTVGKPPKAGSAKATKEPTEPPATTVPSSVPPVDAGGQEKPSVKFSQTTLVLKVKRPGSPPDNDPKALLDSNKKANGATTISQACRSADSPDVIGSGSQHLLTQSHLDHRASLFRQLHDNLLQYQPDLGETAPTLVTGELLPRPTFHFLNAGRAFTVGMEQPGQAGRPIAVCVWWSGSTQIMHYSLLKVSKGGEVDHKPDTVWPFSCAITCSTVSPCTSLMAVGVENGNVVLWDRFVGIERGVVKISNNGPGIRQIQFLDPSICPQDDGPRLVHGTKTAVYLLVLAGDGSLHLKRCGAALSEMTRSVQLAPPRPEEGQALTVIQPFSAIPQVILLVHRNGNIYIQDIVTGKILCQATLPKSHDTASPWQPVLAVGGGGQMLYVKGQQISEAENTAAENDDANSPVVPQMALFVFQLRSFPTLDKFWQMERRTMPYVVPSGVVTRIDALLKDRISRQGARKQRLEERWEFFSTELVHIHEAKAALRALSAKSSFAESSIPRSPLLTTKQHSLLSAQSA